MATRESDQGSRGAPAQGREPQQRQSEPEEPDGFIDDDDIPF